MCTISEVPISLNAKGMEVDEKQLHKDPDPEPNQGLGLGYKCNKCSKNFESEKSLHMHLIDVKHPYRRKLQRPEGSVQCKRYKNKKCKYCIFSSYSSNSLITHITRMHPSMDKKPFHCSLCTRCYSHEFSLRRHTRDNHKQIYTPKTSSHILCKMCSSTFTFKSALAKHVQEMHNIDIEKKDDSPANNVDANSHEMEECTATTNKEAECSGTGSGSGFGTEATPIPNSSETKNSGQSQHQHQDLGHYQCDTCSEVFTVQVDLDMHLREANACYIFCHNCLLAFANKEMYELHKTTPCIKRNPNPKTKSKKVAKRNFADVSKKHEDTSSTGNNAVSGTGTGPGALKVEALELVEEPKPERILSKLNTEYKCEICPEFIGSKTSLQEHLLKEHEQRIMRSHFRRLKYKYKCDFCNYATNSMKSLNCHKRFHRHSVYKPEQPEKTKFRCFLSACKNKSFKTEWNLVIHIESFHQDYYHLLYTCEEKDCSAKFTLQSSFRKHHKKKHQKFYCNDCFTSFTKFEYDAHLEYFDLRKNSATNPNLEQQSKRSIYLQCRKCSTKIVPNLCSLSIHSKIHSNSNNSEDSNEPKSSIVCRKCFKLFQSIESLEYHIKSIHPQPQHKQINELKENVVAQGNDGNINDRDLDLELDLNLNLKDVQQQVEGENYTDEMEVDLSELQVKWEHSGLEFNPNDYFQVLTSTDKTVPNIDVNVPVAGAFCSQIIKIDPGIATANNKNPSSSLPLFHFEHVKMEFPDPESENEVTIETAIDPLNN